MNRPNAARPATGAHDTTATVITADDPQRTHERQAMRALLGLTLAAVLISTAYAASPFYAAWTLRQAIVTGDTATIARKVEWQEVRRSLRASIASYADLVPLVKSATSHVRPTTWQRVKSAFGYSMLDRFVDTYITAEGLPKLYRLRETTRGTREVAVTRARATMMAAGASPSTTDQTPWTERAAGVLKRIRRAEFLSLTEVELVIRDRHQADRHFVGVLTLKGFEWTLTSLRVLRIDDASTGAVTAERGPPPAHRGVIDPARRLPAAPAGRVHQL